MTEPMLAKWLRWMVYASTLIPLVIFAQFMSPFHFGKVIILRVVVEAMVVLFILLAWRDRSYRPKMHLVGWAFLGFALAFTLATVFSVAPGQSFWGTLERMGGLWTFWHYFAFFIIATSVVRTREHWTRLLDLMVAVAAVSALYGFLQKTDWSFILGSGGRARPFGTIGNPALFAGYQIVAAYLAVTLVAMKQFGPNAGVPAGSPERGGVLIGAGLGGALLLALALPGQGLWIIPLGLTAYGTYLAVAGLWGARAGRWAYIVAAAMMFLGAISTAVRGSLLAIAVATVVFALLWSTLNRSKRAKTALLGLLGAVAVFFFLAVLLRNSSLVKGSPYLTRVTDFSSSTFTVQTRFWAWEAGMKGWSESPRTMLVGWGPENFNVPFSKYFNPEFFTGPGAETFFDRAHNMFIEVLVTMGAIGVLTYLGLFAAVLWTLIGFMKKEGDLRVLGIGMTALVIAYAIHNSFIFDTSANFIAFFTVLAFIVHVAQRGLDGEPAPTKTKGAPWTAGQLAAAGAMALITLPTAYATNVVPVQANYAATRAIIAGWQGDFFTAVSQYRTAIDYNTPTGRYEHRHRFAQYLLEMATAENIGQVPNFNDIVAKSIEDVQANADENPSDYLPLLYISRLHLTLGKADPASPHNDEALAKAMAALDISPTFVRTYYEIAQAYLNKKEPAKAVEWFQKAIALNPDVPITHWYLGMVLIQEGKVQEGLKSVNQALVYGYPLTETDMQKLVSVYLELGDYRSIGAIYEQLLKQFPDRADYWAQLALVYAQLGNKDLAVAATRKAMELDQSPGFQAEAQAFLKTLGIQ